MWNHIDKYVSNFTTVRRVVIPSKSLRIPELLVTLFIVVGAVGWELIYKLNFLAVLPLEISVDAIFYQSMKNWWDCWTPVGTCVYDAPQEEGYCNEDHTYDTYNITLKAHAPTRGKVPCKPFDTNTDLVQKQGDLRLTTYIQRLHEVKDSAGRWQQTQGNLDHWFTVGAEQMVQFGGTVPAGVVGINNLGMTQGFLRYADGTDRRIRCAQKETWLPICPLLSEGSPAANEAIGKYWSTHFPAIGLEDGANATDFFLYNSTGCIRNVGGYLECHVSELLRAANVSLENDSLRSKGLVLTVNVLLTNSDLLDYWSWPIGRKPKFVIKVQPEWTYEAIHLYSSYELDATNSSVRSRLDHFGMHLKFSSSTRWMQFSLRQFAGVLVIVLGVMKYSKLFVTNVLVSVYAFFGSARHVSLLFEYSAKMRSATEEEIKAVEKDPSKFRRLTSNVKNSYIQHLLSK